MWCLVTAALAKSYRQEGEELAYQWDLAISGVCDSLYSIRLATELLLEKSVTRLLTGPQPMGLLIRVLQLVSRVGGTKLSGEEGIEREGCCVSTWMETFIGILGCWENFVFHLLFSTQRLKSSKAVLAGTGCNGQEPVPAPPISKAV